MLQYWNMDRPRQTLPGADLSSVIQFRASPTARAPCRPAFATYPADEPLPGCPCGIMGLQLGGLDPAPISHACPRDTAGSKG